MKSNDTGIIDLWELLHLFRSHAGKILCCLLLAVAGGLYYLAHAAPVYASTLLLEIAPDPSDGEPAANLSDSDIADVQKTIELKLTSPAVLLRVIRKFHLDRDPDFTRPEGAATLAATRRLQRLEAHLFALLKSVHADRYVDVSALDPPPPQAPRPLADVELVQRLANRTKVQLVRGSRLLSMTVEDRNPQRARDLAQAIVDEFFQESYDERSRNLATTRNLLLAEARRDSDTLRDSEERVAAYRRKYNAVSLQDQQNIVVDRLRELNRQVAEAQDERLAREPEARQVRLLADTDPDQLLSLRSVADAPEVIELRKEVALQEATVATLAKRYGPLHPTMIQANSQLRALRTARAAGIRKAASRILQSYAAAKATEAALRAALEKQEHASMELAQIAIPYHALERQVQANGAVYQKVLGALKQTDVTQSLLTRNDVDGMTIRTIGHPLVPTEPARPRPRLIFALSLVVGLFAGCSTALVARALDNTVSSVDAAEEILRQPVLATVPRSRHQRMTGLPVVVRYPRSAEAEAFRSLRTSLSALPNEPEGRCILFTSAIPNEGKTFCSLNTAVALAQQGFKTLLIDGDLRRPRLQRLLIDWNSKPSLTDCLRNPELFPAAVHSTPIRNLSCLGDRKSQAGAPELLGSAGLTAILRRAQTEYDRVVIDSAPLLAVSDALCIARRVPTVCLVVHTGSTPRRSIQRAARLLEEVAKRSLAGVVLNKADRRTAAHNYNYYRAATPS
jgi:polysaccharide biosynthesis transport protein